MKRLLHALQLKELPAACPASWDRDIFLVLMDVLGTFPQTGIVSSKPEETRPRKDSNGPGF